jgi:hypothetical protein
MDFFEIIDPNLLIIFFMAGGIGGWLYKIIYLSEEYEFLVANYSTISELCALL